MRDQRLITVGSRASRAGFSQLELICAVAFLLIATLGFSQSLIAGMRLADATHERALAIQAARQCLEELEDGTFAQVFARYNADPADDPGVAGSAPGSAFAVAGLNALGDDADGKVGEIVLPASGTQLREDLDLPELGLPRDLDGDGVIDATNHAGDYQLLPVLVRVEWRSKGAPMKVELRTFLCER
jgi:type II secretory pathway pseudopilin PulG